MDQGTRPSGADAQGERRTDWPTDGLLLLVTAVGTGAGLGVGASAGRPNWPVYLVVVLLGATVVVALHRRFRFTLATRLGLVVFALGHVAGGMAPVGDGVLYGTWLVEPVVRYDNVQHAWGFGFVGRAVWETLASRLGSVRGDRLVAWWLVVIGASAFGAANEIIEWVLTLTIPGTDVGGYDNTARDLVANLVGGVLVATWTVRRSRGAGDVGRQGRSTRRRRKTPRRVFLP